MKEGTYATRSSIQLSSRSPWLRRCIEELFTHQGELVLDPFVGSGTTLVAARDLDRNAVGFDLQKNFIDLCRERWGQDNLSGKCRQIAFHEDARRISHYPEEETLSLILTSPPYANLLTRRKKTRADGPKIGKINSP